jgi:hypothetical protein
MLHAGESNTKKLFRVCGKLFPVAVNESVFSQCSHPIYVSFSCFSISCHIISLC